MRDRDRLRQRLADLQRERGQLRESIRKPPPFCPRYRAQDQDRLFNIDREISEISARLGDRD